MMLLISIDEFIVKDLSGSCLSAAINECDPKDPQHDCEQICVKEKISYTCACKKGYRLTKNKKTCSGKIINKRFTYN